MSDRGALHLTLPAAGCCGWNCTGTGAGDAYVRVARAKATWAPRVSARGDGCRRCTTRRDRTCTVPPPPQAPGRHGPAPSFAPGSQEPLAAGASFRRRQLVPPLWRHLLASILLWGPIFQIEKLTLQALKCFAPASREGSNSSLSEWGALVAPIILNMKSMPGALRETFPCS